MAPSKPPKKEGSSATNKKKTTSTSASNSTSQASKAASLTNKKAASSSSSSSKPRQSGFGSLDGWLVRSAGPGESSQTAIAIDSSPAAPDPAQLPGMGVPKQSKEIVMAGQDEQGGDESHEGGGADDDMGVARQKPEPKARTDLDNDFGYDDTMDALFNAEFDEREKADQAKLGIDVATAGAIDGGAMIIAGSAEMSKNVTESSIAKLHSMIGDGLKTSMFATEGLGGDSTATTASAAAPSGQQSPSSQQGGQELEFDGKRVKAVANGIKVESRYEAENAMTPEEYDIYARHLHRHSKFALPPGERYLRPSDRIGGPMMDDEEIFYQPSSSAPRPTPTLSVGPAQTYYAPRTDLSSSSTGTTVPTISSASSTAGITHPTCLPAFAKTNARSSMVQPMSTGAEAPAVSSSSRNVGVDARPSAAGAVAFSSDVETDFESKVFDKGPQPDDGAFYGWRDQFVVETDPDIALEPAHTSTVTKLTEADAALALRVIDIFTEKTSTGEVRSSTRVHPAIKAILRYYKLADLQQLYWRSVDTASKPALDALRSGRRPSQEEVNAGREVLLDGSCNRLIIYGDFGESGVGFLDADAFYIGSGLAKRAKSMRKDARPEERGECSSMATGGAQRSSCHESATYRDLHPSDYYRLGRPNAKRHTILVLLDFGPSEANNLDQFILEFGLPEGWTQDAIRIGLGLLCEGATILLTRMYLPSAMKVIASELGLPLPPLFPARSFRPLNRASGLDVAGGPLFDSVSASIAGRKSAQTAHIRYEHINALGEVKTDLNGYAKSQDAKKWLEAMRRGAKATNDGKEVAKLKALVGGAGHPANVTEKHDISIVTLRDAKSIAEFVGCSGEQRLSPRLRLKPGGHPEREYRRAEWETRIHFYPGMHQNMATAALAISSPSLAASAASTSRPSHSNRRFPGPHTKTTLPWIETGAVSSTYYLASHLPPSFLWNEQSAQEADDVREARTPAPRPVDVKHVQKFEATKMGLVELKESVWLREQAAWYGRGGAVDGAWRLDTMEEISWRSSSSDQKQPAEGSVHLEGQPAPAQTARKSDYANVKLAHMNSPGKPVIAVDAGGYLTITLRSTRRSGTSDEGHER